ncbi:hypothetical protein [Carboxylicivirga marina]|uniref:hypothetical protein n=1 Tax=Carboxylicivirga marina TaxID=2800988 RepID=UPI002593D462|nr:hypothetical protein [uncultured Carboxylicivirga sp.]
MVKVKLYIIVSLLAGSLVVNSQSLKQWGEQLNKLEQKTDPNNKRFDLLELSKGLKEIWRDENDINEVLHHTNKLTVSKSADKKMTIAAFGNSTYQGVFQLEWLVQYDNRIWSFSEEFNYNGSKSSSDFTYTLSGSDADLYSFQINDGKQEIVDAIDVVTKCKFEELQQMQGNEQKDSLNTVLLKRLNFLWSDKSKFETSFKQLKRMKTLISDDEKVKICTYNIQKEGFNQLFYGAVILNDGDLKVIPLNDTSPKIKSPERSTLSDKKWYGAIYLDLIQNQSGNKTYYTLLGYKGHGEFVKTRVIDVLIVQNGRLRFGGPIFKSDRITRNRLVFKYSAKATMMVRYDSREKMIVFDNLAPTEPMFRGVYQYYGPDFSYNALKFTKGVWQLRKDVDLRNPKLN